MEQLALIIIDHGSKRRESNAMLELFVERFRAAAPAGKYVAVEAAHMELAEPTMAQAFERCAAAGAMRVVVMPYFLLPGRHWSKDIPNLAAKAAAEHPGVEFVVTAPFGLHPLMMQLVEARVEHCLKHAQGEAGPCDVCEGTAEGCVLRGGGEVNAAGVAGSGAASASEGSLTSGGLASGGGGETMRDEANYICESCGEEIVIPIDPSAGSSQQYVEDCPVCCAPNVIRVEFDESGDVQVWAQRE